MKNYKLHTLEEVLEFTEKNNIKTDYNGYDVTTYCKGMFKYEDEDDKILEQGFFYVQDKDDASHLGGAWFNHFGFLRLTVSKDIDKLMTIEESIRHNFKWEMEHFKQFSSKANYKITLNQHLIEPTKEKPYTVYFCGDDDFSWTKTYKTEKDAQDAIRSLCMRSGNIMYGSFEESLKELDFVFTN